jgi:hypothetical protein
MKRQDPIRHIESYACRLLREGGKHSVYYNPENNQTSAIPRHREINGFLARKIAETLGFRNRDRRARGCRRAAFTSSGVDAFSRRRLLIPVVRSTIRLSG